MKSAPESKYIQSDLHSIHVSSNPYVHVKLRYPPFLKNNVPVGAHVAQLTIWIWRFDANERQLRMHRIVSNFFEALKLLILNKGHGSCKVMRFGRQKFKMEWATKQRAIENEFKDEKNSLFIFVFSEFSAETTNDHTIQSPLYNTTDKSTPKLKSSWSKYGLKVQKPRRQSIRKGFV